MTKMNVSIPGETIPQLVEFWAHAPGSDTPAFVSFDENGEKRSLNRRQVFHFARRFAHRLRRLGARKGTIICNALPNSLERLICDFGIVFSGAVSMNGQIFRADGEDFLDSLQTSECFMVIVGPSAANRARKCLLNEVPEGCEDSVQSTRLPHLQKLLYCVRDDCDPTKDFISSLEDSSLPEFMENVVPSELASVMTTSGSTGYSKLVKLTHQNLCHFCLQVKAIEHLASGSRFINCAPLGWAGGYPQWYLSCGVTRYFLDMHDGPPRDLPATIWKTIVEEKVVYGFLSPMYVNAILSNTASWQNVSWKPKTLCLAGQPVKKQLLDIIGKLCESVDINYGITENNLVSTHRITDSSTYIDGCAGYPGFGVQVKVVDKQRNELPKGKSGEILVCSPSLCQGYLNNDEATKSTFTDDGWLCTDDAGYVGEDGKLYVKGRQSDSIMRGAYILYPGWLEVKLREVPGVKDVAVVAVPDKVLHNEICACVLTDDVMGSVVGRLHENNAADHSVDTERQQTSVMPSSTVSSVSEESFNEDVDEPDNASFGFLRLQSKGLTDHLVNTQNDNDSKYGGVKGPSVSRAGKSKELERIRTEGVHTQLTTSYNKTKALEKPIKGEKGNHGDLLSLEQRLREYADGLQVLSEKDAMRMVPKYYIFVDKFPLTSTGKLSRKEVRKTATALLDLC
ncbi:putative peroxisomal-coenzyme A synthetase isoform X2 [Aplysia californica]|uniref:Peroxisomal-coenzyme A synthetase isoform X2 n=1 Tax=Aplysia californica TaxID=6500 RepID=A0ABM0JVL7_APLCA|nr:putative peroxisomal-coenzyme A synthetase isoform X2 [Aplysia californica]